MNKRNINEERASHVALLLAHMLPDTFLLSSDEIVEYGDWWCALQKVEKVDNRSKRSKR